VSPPTPRQPSRPTPPPAPPRLSPLPFAGMIGLACVLFVDVASLAVVDWWVVLVLVVVWVAVFLVALAWWSPHPRRLPWLAVLGFVLWVVVVIGGSIAFGG
jgi:hypothetical protein